MSTWRSSAKGALATLFPATVDGTIRGSRVPTYVLAAVALVSTVRSLIHLLAPDGGAGSIAGIDLTVAGADGIVFAFGLWGSSQLLLALVQVLVVVRYPSLVPLMYLLLILEALLRQLVAATKPVAFAHVPPGAYFNDVVLLLAIAMLALSLWSARGVGGGSTGRPRSIPS